MGLFDAYDPNTYAPGATQGGLIDSILAQYAEAPTNAGPGFPASPMDANAAEPAPQPQNAPIAVGDYQMPRIGGGFPGYPEHDPHTGETVAPVQQPTQPAALAAPAPSPDLGDHLMTGYQNMRHGGGLIGSIVAAVTGQRNDPQAELQNRQQAQLRQQFTALVNAGLSPQEATVAVLNPEAGKAIVTQKFGPQHDSFSIVQIGEDGLGKKTFSKINKATGEMMPISAAPGADASGGGLGDMSKTGGAYLATLPPQQAGIVKAMVEGRQPPPSSFALSKPYWQNMLQAAQAYDPTFDATNWSGRVASVRDFAAGKSAEMVRSANQTLAHVDALLNSADDLHNGNYPSLNWVGNKYNEATGGGEPGAFRTNAHAVAEEMSKVFKGANMSDAEIHAWEENLSPNMSPAQQRAQIKKLSELLHGSLDALEEKRVAGMGQMAAEKAGPLIKPEGQTVLKRIDTWLKSGNAAGASGTAPTGVKWSVVQ
ncbi:hypothetical protein [Bradyrhizobium sp. Bra78]|uniref:hypothetical protein n=1 Tax=Bradyrhizobium sp. Bra78 TaxID=2926010 RepID=UPI0021C96412|nr:hypothetical protein [Bradyrhizobium sp. Bra78]